MRMKCKIGRIFGLLTCLSICFLFWTVHGEPTVHTMPAAQPCDLTGLLEKTTWTASDYRMLTEQTGLTSAALDLLRQRDELDTIPDIQNAYFQPVAATCTANQLISRSERLTEGAAPLTALEDGDILLTPCSHVFGWRNGHAALVVDAEQGTTLEAIVIGQNSTLRSIDHWKALPAVAVYRLRGVDAETRSAIAQTAARRLTDVPYSLTVGILSAKRTPGAVTGTQCAHLVWEAFAAFGYDLDANGGGLVTPGDLARSPLLELKQVYGLPLTD